MLFKLAFRNMKKSIKIIKLVLIIMLSIVSSIAIYNYFKYNYNKNYIITTKIENNYKTPPIIKEKDLLMKNNNYIGYIKIDKYNINKFIMLGTSDNILNKNVVGLYKYLKDLDSKTGITLLAGHNNIYVFKNLNKLKIGDEEIIGSKFYTYKYKVVSKKIIKKDDYSIFEGGDERVIILLTCVSDDLRLVVTCK